MEANELRIGNWVSFKGLWNGQISEINDAGIVQFKGNKGVFDIEALRPIPIDKKMLERLGAEEFSDDLLLNNRVVAYAECRNEYYDAPTSVTLKSIHQYQNIIFALTGQELTITP